MTTRAREVEAWLRAEGQQCRRAAHTYIDGSFTGEKLLRSAEAFEHRASALSALIAECEEARKLLEPFAMIAAAYAANESTRADHHRVSIALGDCRAARAFIARRNGPAAARVMCG